MRGEMKHSYNLMKMKTQFTITCEHLHKMRSNKQSNDAPQTPRKIRTRQRQISRQKEIIKIRVDTNEMEM
jgi:hypothetical protein